MERERSQPVLPCCGAKMVSAEKTAPGAENQVFGLKSQVSDFVPAYVEVIAAINATDAMPSRISFVPGVARSPRVTPDRVRA